MARSCSHTGKLYGCGRAVPYQLSLLVPPCTEEKVVARCEMVPPLLCYLMALVCCVLPSILASQCLILPKLPCLQSWNRCRGPLPPPRVSPCLWPAVLSAVGQPGSPLWLWHQLCSALKALGLQNRPTVAVGEAGRYPEQQSTPGLCRVAH